LFTNRFVNPVVKVREYLFLNHIVILHLLPRLICMGP
jgi:hypothetical protein